ncbi:MAG: AIR synthase-related protein [Lachnospiraceae bacterium]|nr:AIR synthase-related protein [Lachnospiraceae bacterium]
MRTGKLSESVLRRSILKQIKNRRQEVIQGAGIGKDCAFFSFGEELLAISTASFSVFEEDSVFGRIIESVNNVAAGGAAPVGILISAVLPEETGEQEIKALMAEVEKACCRLNIQAVGGDTRISREVNRPQLTVTVVGKAGRGKYPSRVCAANQDVVMTKWAGLSGTAFLAKKNTDKLVKRLPAHLIHEAAAFGEMLSVLPEAAAAAGYGVSSMHDVSRGGVFTALWELAEGAGVGLEVDLKKIPIRQETVEICEILGVNPYELYGAGSLLIVCDKGNQLVGMLKQENIYAAVIGKTTADKAKVLWNQEEKRYLDRPRIDMGCL